MTDRNFQRDFLAELGFDLDDREVHEAAEDAARHANLITSLRRLRRVRGLRQKQVAARMGTTQSRVSDFERIGGDPRLSTVFRYARAVDAEVRLVVKVNAPRGWEQLDSFDLPAAPTAAPTKLASSWTAVSA